MAKVTMKVLEIPPGRPVNPDKTMRTLHQQGRLKLSRSTAPSLLRASVLARLGAVAFVSAVLWLAILWALT